MIFPDYTGVTVPPNIAPLDFTIRERGSRFFVRLGAEVGDPIEILSSSPKITIPIAQWRDLLDMNRGRQLRCDVYVEQDAEWLRHEQIVNPIANEDIDSNLVYRSIPPIHNKWREIAVRQRDLTSFDDSVVLNGLSFGAGCVNCHSFANNDPNRMLIGIRSSQFGSAVVLAEDGRARKIGTRFGYTAWHPSGRFAVYSINKVWQFFHTTGSEVRDVIDLDSALAYYTFESKRARLVPGASDKQRLETYPAWTPDGKFLYFCSAPLLWEKGTEIPPARFAEVQYDLMRIAYDVDGDQWGAVETVLSAEETGLSLLLPRVSPDGRFLLFCMCQYGCFPIYQPTSDLYMMDLKSGSYAKLDINSDRSESWHSWSSNSRWIAFSSKRLGEPFTRCFFSYVNESGTAHKPLLMPQEDPEFYHSSLKTVSVPEFTTGPVPVTDGALSQAVRSPESIAVDSWSGATASRDTSNTRQPMRE